MINMWAAILISDSNLTKIKYGNVFLKHIFNCNLLQSIAHRFYEFLLSSILFSVFLFMHLITKVIWIKAGFLLWKRERP